MLETILKKFQNEINGVIQVGAHIGQEVDLFTKYTDSNIYLFEPNKDAFEHLKRYDNEKKIYTFNFGLGNSNENKSMFVSDHKKGVSSSVLEPKLHLKYFPEYNFSKKIEIEIKKFSDLSNITGNFLMIDVQGYELEVLKGFGTKLDNIDFIFTEISLAEIYDGGVNVRELDKFLNNKGFVRSYTSLVSNVPMGDAFYINKNNINKPMQSLFKYKALLTGSGLFRFFNYFKDLNKLSFHIKNKLKEITIKFKIYNLLINIRDILRIFYNQKRRSRFFWFLLGGDNRFLSNYDFDNNALIFDIGAYLGDYTYTLNNKFKCNIYAFEPIKEYFSLIENRFSKNKNIRLFNIGFTNSDGKDYISKTEGHSSLVSREEGHPDTLVEIRSISSFLKEEKISNISLMTINIEGSEYKFFDDLISTGLINQIDHLEIQFHNFVPNAKNLRKDVRKRLAETHSCKFSFPFVWERWDKK